MLAGGAVALSFRGAVAGRPVGRDTVFYAASVTKQLVGFLLAGAVERGLASPADEVRRWLPELPAWTAGIRLGHLLHHTSGLPDVTRPWLRPSDGNAAVIDRLCRLEPPVRIAPGESFVYNNAGYVLLAEVTGRVRAQPFVDLAGAEVFRPLALGSTRLGGPPLALPGTPDPPGTVGDGGLWTSIADLLRWLAALDDGTLDAAAGSRMVTEGRLDDGTPLDYAWGVRRTRTATGPQVSHGGTWGGWLAKTVRLPGHGVAVAVLSTGGVEDEISGLGTDLAARLVA